MVDATPRSGGAGECEAPAREGLIANVAAMHRPLAPEAGEQSRGRRCRPPGAGTRTPVLHRV